MLETQFSEIFQVTKNDCISEIDDSLPDLLGTYILVKWMEIVCAKNSNRLLDDSHITVGQKVSIEHTGMVKRGEEVQIISTREKREKRRISFTIDAIAGGKIIATASHDRIIIPTKIIAKLMKSTK